MKRLIISAVLAVSLANASIGDFIQSNLDGSIQSTGAGYYKTQAGGFWDAGSVRIRWDMSGANINLFHAKAPAFNVGCNGIDATFGSFSYLGFDQLVDKLKKIAAAAPAMAFQMAIMTLCEQCNTIMTNLEKIADSLNNFNLNACQASTELARKMASSIINFGGADDATQVRTKWQSDKVWGITETLQKWSQAFGTEGETGAKNLMGYGSYLNKIADTYAPVAGIDQTEFLALMRAVIGDIYGFADIQKDTSGADQSRIGNFVFIEPTASVKQLSDVFTKGGDIDVTLVNAQKDANGNYLPLSVVDVPDFATAKSTTGIVHTTLSIPEDKALVTLYKNKIEELITKLKTKQPFTDTDIAFINAMPIPLYRVINIEATLGSDNISDVAEYMAYRSVDAFLNQYFQQMMRAFSSLQENAGFKETEAKKAKEWAHKVAQNYRILDMVLQNNLKLAYDKIKTNKVITDVFRNMENQMFRLSPIWAANTL